MLVVKKMMIAAQLRDVTVAMANAYPCVEDKFVLKAHIARLLTIERYAHVHLL